MGFSNIIKTFDNDKAREDGRESFTRARDAWFSYVGGLAAFGVLLDGAPVAALRLARAIATRAGFRGKIYLVGSADGLREQLAFFKPSGEFAYNDGTLSCSMELAAALPEGLELVVARSRERQDAEKIPCRYYVQVTPWGAGQLSFAQYTSESEQPQRVTYYFDHMLWQRPYADLPFYRDPESLQEVPAPIKAYWGGAYAKARACEALVSLCDSALVLPVEEGGEAPLLLLGLAALEILPADKAVLLVDFSGGSWGVLRMFAEKEPQQWMADLCGQFPAAVGEQLQKALLAPLSGLYRRLGSKLARVHFPEDLADEKIQPGHLYVCALKAAPGDYRDVIYARSKLPPALAEAETACVPLCAGRLCLCTGKGAYPAVHGAVGAGRLMSLSRPLSNHISLYLNAADLELEQETAALSAFFREAMNGADTEAARYCKAYGRFAENGQNRRLEQAAAMAFAYTMAPVQRKTLPKEEEPDGLEKLYQKLVAGITDHKLILSQVLPESRGARYLDTLAGGNEALCFATDKKDVVRVYYDSETPDEELGELKNVTVWNARTRLGGTDFMTSLCFSGLEDNEPLVTTFSGTVKGEFPLDGLPWLRLQNVEFVLSVCEDAGIASMRFGADVKDTPLHLFMTMGADGSRRLQGAFSTPVTAMDACFALAGGVDFVKALPPELQTLAGIGLESVTLQLDQENLSVTRMEFVLTATDAWLLWEQGGKPLITLRPRLEIAITSPQDLQNRAVEVTVSGDCAFGEEGRAGEMQLTGSYPPLTLGLSLLSPLKLDELLGMFGDFPVFEADVTELEVYGAPSDSYYFLRACVQGDWKLSEEFSVTGLGLELVTEKKDISVAFSGMMLICTVQAGVCVRWRTGAGWDLLARLSTGGGLSMSDLVQAYSGGRGVLSADGENDPALGSLTARFSTSNGDWSIEAAVQDWDIPFLSMTVTASATVGQREKKFRCSLDAQLNWNGIELSLGYSYLQGKNGFYFSWGAFSGSITDGIGTLVIQDISLGSMVEAMVGWATGTPFGLDAPWDLLSAISLEAFTLTYHFETGDVSMEANAPLDLGFAQVQGVRLTYAAGPAKGKKGQVQVTLTGNFPWNTGQGALGNTGRLGPWDAAAPGSAPVPDGKGSGYFDLRMLALGQRAGLFSPAPLTVEDAVNRLNQYDPETLPAYDPAAGWIVGSDFGILRDKNSGLYLLNAKLIFCDPSLFALRITCDSDAAKLFKGLSFDILYCKISDTIGLYKGCVTLPDRMRYFDIGAYSLTLPCFTVEVYTNGDFKLDLGFPHEGDFSCSFSISGMVGAIPFVGAAGLYLGKLSSATAASSGLYLPETPDGLFNPAIVFGVGLRFGIGKRLDAGILKAGFSFTLTAILEGVCAKFNPYGGQPADWYYALSGMAGIDGEIYGSIDFVIICAAVNLKVGLEVDYALMAYRSARFTVSAYIEASASLIINLGLFKIKLSFSFSFLVCAGFTVGSDSHAPWDGRGLPALSERRRQITALDFTHFRPASIEALAGRLSLPLTVAADEWGGKEGKVCAVTLMTVSAADFERLAKKAVCWAVAAGLEQPATEEELLCRTVDDGYLGELEKLLAEHASVSWEAADGFLSSCFTLEVADKALMEQNGEEDGVLFPIPPALSLSFQEDGVVLYRYQLDDFSSVSAQALEHMREEFDRLAMAVDEESAKGTGRGLGNAPEISMARWLLIDYVRLLVRQAVKNLRTEAEKGGRPLKELLDELQKGGVLLQLGGMISRYQLHGLRIPTAGIGARSAGGWSRDGKFPPELGIWSLCGTELPVTGKSRVVFGKGTLACSWLSLPDNYTLKVDSGLFEGLAKLAVKGFAPSMAITPGTPVKVPLSVSFGRPMELDGLTAWNVPDGLPREAGAFKLELLCAKERDGSRLRRIAAEGFQTAALIEFTVKKTQTPNVFLIAGSSERCAMLLSHVVAEQLPVLDCRLVGMECRMLRVMQMDLSTETHPPLDKGMGNPWPDFLKTLWEAFVTNNGGYILAVRPVEPFPDRLFNDRGEGVFTLAVLYDAVPVENPAVNGVLYAGVVGKDDILTAIAQSRCSYIAPGAESTASYINAQWKVGRADPGGSAHAGPAEELLDHSYTLLRYGVCDGGGFPASGGSMPVGPDKSWSYSFTLPADSYLGGAGYLAAGRRLSVRLEWLDLYGNHFPAPTRYCVDCGYMDGLLGLSRYPGVTARWRVLPERGLCIGLSFNREACMQQPSAAATYRRIQAQLGDPGGVSLCLLSPLFPSPTPFSPEQWTQLRSWVEAIWKTIAGAAPAPGEITFSFPLGGISGEDKLFALTCSLRLTRRGAPARGFEQVDCVRSVTSVIPLPEDVKQFAAQLETALSMIRVLKGRDQLYALRSDLVQVEFKQEPSLRVFAPRPVSNTLRAEHAVMLYDYTSGKGLSQGGIRSYLGVDLNVWMKNALAIIDGTYTPPIAGAAAALEQAQPGISGYSRLLSGKRALAGRLAGLLAPVFAQQSAVGLDEARQVFRQRLLSRLSNLYDVRAVVSAAADVTGSIEAARLYGGVSARTSAAGMTLSPAKILMRDGGAECAFTISGDDLVRGENGEILSAADFSLTWEATHMETEIHNLADGFEGSSWLQGVTGPILTAGMGKVSVPFPLYTFPEMPVMQEHGQIPAGDDSCCAYRFTYSNTVHYPQLMPHITVAYNLPPGQSQAGRDAGSLFTVLARIDAVGSAILEDLASAARRINASETLPDPASADAVVFAAAAGALLELVDELAGAPLSCASPKAVRGDAIRFTLSEAALDGALTVTVRTDGISQAEARDILPFAGPADYTPALVSSGEEGFTYVFEDGKKKRLPSAWGQRIRERTLVLPPRRILEFRNAQAQMYTRQNHFLVPGRETAPEFVFTTGVASFSGPAAATAAVTAEKDIRAFLGKGQADTLTNCLRGLFAAYIGEAKAVTLQAECRYQRTLGSRTSVKVEQPIFLQTPTEIQDGDTQALICSWAEAVAAWRLEFPPERRPWLESEGLHFDIVFTDAGNPVLSLKNCLYDHKPVIE